MGILSKTVKVSLVVAILSCVLFVFVCPELDLEPSALRAIRIAAIFFMMLVFPARLITGVFSPDFSEFWSQPSDDKPFYRLGDLQSLTCSRLC